MTIEETAEKFDNDSDEATHHQKLQETNSADSDDNSSLEALVNQEQELAFKQLREELGREPTPEEADEWLNAHTESY